jgi:hypothetical protein
MLYYCNDCKLKFPNPAQRLINHTEVDTRRFETQSVCPACGGDDIEEMKRCVCGAYRLSYEDYCERCTEFRDAVRQDAISTLIGALGISYTDAIELLFSGLED